ncbi:MAG TPA: ammonia-forming cytochrome c nitrite reductase subunit c552 [Planctomycetota bacterium]
MSDKKRRWVLAGIAAGSALLTVLVMLLWLNILERQEEGRHAYVKVVELTEDTVDPAEWGKNFPRQYESYRRTVDTERTRHGGSDAFQKLDEDPRWRILFDGYAFGVDYREERGHAYMLADQDMTERVKNFKQPGACLHCHSSILPAYAEAGKKAGATTRADQILKGFEVVCGMPYAEARKGVAHPVSCVDCHDPGGLNLRVTRPGFLYGIRELAKSGAPLPHLPSVERWRKDGRKDVYDPNVRASRQELRSLVCAQCHVEYYFKGEGKLLTYPWSKGVLAENIEAYYDEAGWKDWTHARSGAPVLKAQHPEFELWSQGIHARSGVACADCHMPYVREGAVKVSDHHVRSPLLNVARACQTCHRYGEDEILARARAIQDRTRGLMIRAEEAVVGLIAAIEKAPPGDALQEARNLHRKAQWRLDFVAAENSMGFHAPGEAARLLGEAIDFARQGEIRVLRKP